MGTGDDLAVCFLFIDFPLPHPAIFVLLDYLIISRRRHIALAGGSGRGLGLQVDVVSKYSNTLMQLPPGSSSSAVLLVVSVGRFFLRLK